ncbi:MAG: glutamate-cysteine ligase family protein [Peptococcaceae bacterium]
MLKEQIVGSLKKNEVAHEEFKLGVCFGHFLVNRDDLKAVPFEGEQGIESLLEYLTRNGWEGLYEEEALIGVRKDNATVLLQAGGQIEVWIEKTASLKVIDKTYLDFLQNLGSELEARNQLLLSIGYQPVSKAEDIELMPMAKAKLLAEQLQDDPAALKALKAAAKTVVVLDYAHSDDFEKKYRVVATLAPVFAALLDNIPVLDGEEYNQFTAGIALDDDKKTALAKVENVITGHSFKYAQYSNFVANAPAVAVEENQQIVASAKTNEEVYEDQNMTAEQVAGVLDMVMPEVKATTRGLELHFVDALPYPLNMAYVALIKGLLYNADNMNALYEFVLNLNKELLDSLRQTVIEQGMEAKFNEGTVQEVAKDLYFMSTPQLPEEEQHYTQPLDAIIFKHICPKNVTKRQLAAMQGK